MPGSGENILSFEHALELLDDKIVRTSSGSFINVEDLKKLETQFKEAKAAGAVPKAPGMSLRQAGLMAQADAAFKAAFEEPTPIAPADADVVKHVAGEE